MMCLLVESYSLHTAVWACLSLSVSVSIAAGQDALRGEISTWNYCWHPLSLALGFPLCRCMTPIPHTFILHAPNLQSTYRVIGKILILSMCMCFSTKYITWPLFCLDYNNHVTAWPIPYPLGSHTWTKSCPESPVGSVHNGYCTIPPIIPFACNTNIRILCGWVWGKCMHKCHEYQTMSLPRRQLSRLTSSNSRC